MLEVGRFVEVHDTENGVAKELEVVYPGFAEKGKAITQGYILPAQGEG